MLLLADSGSTKTSWALLQNKIPVKRFFSDGFNPYMQTDEQILQAIKTQVITALDEQELRNISAVYFYGAGCSAEDKNKLISDNLQLLIPNASITVQHDLLAAALAVCGKNNGIAAILGTGSNSCLFVDGEIKQNIPSLGLFLGDEGSGGYLGKLFIKKFFYEHFSQEVNQLIITQLKLEKNELLENVYKKPFPNRYLASFTHFIANNLQHHELRNLVNESFTDFVTQVLCKYPNACKLPIGVVGSVGFVFKEILAEVCSANNLTLATVLKDPMEGLINYHANQS